MLHHKRQMSGSKEETINPRHPLHKVPKTQPCDSVETAQTCQGCGQKLGQGADLSTSPLISTLEAARKGSLTPWDAAESAQSCWEMPQQTSLWSDAIRLLPNLTLNSRRWWRMRTLSKILYLFYSEKALIKGLQITWMPSNHSRNILFCYLAFSEFCYQKSHPPQSRGGGTFRGRGTKKFNKGKRT